MIKSQHIKKALKEETDMILRIIFSVVVAMGVIYIAKVAVPVWKMTRYRDAILWIFQNSFDIFPGEKQQIFPENSPQEIKHGRIVLKFSNAQEACDEFEKCIDRLFVYYNQHKWLMSIPDLQEDKEKMSQIKEQVRWLKDH